MSAEFLHDAGRSIAVQEYGPSNFTVRDLSEVFLIAGKYQMIEE